MPSVNVYAVITLEHPRCCSGCDVTVVHAYASRVSCALGTKDGGSPLHCDVHWRCAASAQCYWRAGEAWTMLLSNDGLMTVSVHDPSLTYILTTPICTATTALLSLPPTLSRRPLSPCPPPPLFLPACPRPSARASCRSSSCVYYALLAWAHWVCTRALLDSCEAYNRTTPRLPGLTDGWIPGRLRDNRDHQYRFFRENLPLLSAVLLAFAALSRGVQRATGNALGARLAYYAAFSCAFLVFCNGSGVGFMLAIAGGELGSGAGLRRWTALSAADVDIQPGHPPPQRALPRLSLRRHPGRQPRSTRHRTTHCAHAALRCSAADRALRRAQATWTGTGGCSGGRRCSTSSCCA